MRSLALMLNIGQTINLHINTYIHSWDWLIHNDKVVRPIRHDFLRMHDFILQFLEAHILYPFGTKFLETNLPHNHEIITKKRILIYQFLQPPALSVRFFSL